MTEGVTEPGVNPSTENTEVVARFCITFGMTFQTFQGSGKQLGQLLVAVVSTLENHSFFQDGPPITCSAMSGF